MGSSTVENLPTGFIPQVQATKLLPADVGNPKMDKNPPNPIKEEDNQNDIQRTGHRSITIYDKFSEGKNEYLAGVITHYAEILTHNRMRFLGYPVNQVFDYSELVQLLNFHLDNAGDPFIGGSFAFNSSAFEVCVLDWFASLWEIEKNEYWGYITTCGTEGNLFGMLVGREQFPDGILYTSKESHYSIFRSARMYKMKCITIKTLISGEIDCADLRVSLLLHKDKPAIINLNIGTTIKGAVDDLDLVIQTLEDCGFTRDRFYIHCDGALFGMMIPFVEQAPRITFKKPIGSISISGHKFLGCSIPCGVVITRSEYISELSRDIEDITITGSRDGHAPIFLWYTLNKKGLRELKNEVQNCITNAHYLHNRLRDAGIGTLLNECSSTVVFERPLDDGFARRWNLACQGNIAHVVVLQHVSTELLDSFVDDFLQNRSLWFHGGQNQPPCVAEDIGVDNCVCTSHKY